MTSLPSRTHTNGFTLIEIMVTVALVAVLTAIALPSYQAYRERARNHQAASDIVAMGLVIKARFLDDRAYPDDLSVVNFQNKRDPWGRAYFYYNVADKGRGGARKDKALNPINSDFDLYSAGADGKSKGQVTQKDSVDDVIRANDGAFVGLAADF